MRDKIAQIEGLRDVTTDLYIKNPQMTIEIDREKAAVYGITIDQIRQELFNAFGARQVGTIYTQTNDYQVILESQPKFQAEPSQLQNIYVKTNVQYWKRPGSGVSGNGVPSGRDSDFRSHQDCPRGRSAASEPPGQPAFGHHLVQSCARLFARTGG